MAVAADQRVGHWGGALRAIEFGRGACLRHSPVSPTVQTRAPQRRKQKPETFAAYGIQYTAGKLERVPGILSRAELAAVRERWRREGRRVVLTNGCYDLLHPGHVRLLEGARSLGDVLILALNSDAGVRRSKGDSRPVVGERARAELALALEAVDAVTIFDEDTPRELIAEILPDVLVKGADWAHFVAGREEVEAAGGQVVNLPLEPGYSTTNIVDWMLNSDLDPSCRS